MRNPLWQSEAWKEYESLQAEKAILKKANKLLKDIMRNGFISAPMEKWKCLRVTSADMPAYGSIRRTVSSSEQMKTQ